MTNSFNKLVSSYQEKGFNESESRTQSLDAIRIQKRINEGRSIFSSIQDETQEAIHNVDPHEFHAITKA